MIQKLIYFHTLDNSNASPVVFTVTVTTFADPPPRFELLDDFYVSDICSVFLLTIVSYL